MDAMNTKNPEKSQRRFSVKRIVTLSLAAAIALTIFTGAGIYSRWSRTAAANFKLTETQKKAAEKSGFSTLLEETAETQAAQPSGETAAPASQEEAPLISATDKGITITATQTLVDKYRAHLVFRIEGFTLPEGKSPSIEGGVVSINGKDPRLSGGGGFYLGLTTQRDGTVTYADGSPVQNNEKGESILRYTDENGALEYSIDKYFPYEDQESIGGLQYMEHLGSEIVVKFTSIGVADGLEHVPVVDGDWTLKWTLTGSDDTRTVEPNKPIGDTGFILKSAELTPASCILTLEGDAYSHKSPYVDEYFYWLPQLKGVILKDGSFIMAPMDGGGEKDLGNNLHREDHSMLAANVNDIKSLVFWPMTEEQDLPTDEIIVPIS